MAYHLVCSLPITSCYLLQCSPSLVTFLLSPLLPTASFYYCLGFPVPCRARAFPLHCIVSGLSLHLSPVCILILRLIFIELSCPLQWLLLSVHISTGWQTLLICCYKLRSMQWNSEVWLWHTRLAPAITHLDVRSVQSEAGSLAGLSAKSINISSNYQLSARAKNHNCTLFLIAKAGCQAWTVESW